MKQNEMYSKIGMPYLIAKYITVVCLVDCVEENVHFSVTGYSGINGVVVLVACGTQPSVDQYTWYIHISHITIE